MSSSSEAFQLRKELKLNSGKLKNLELISLDPAVSGLIQKLHAELNISFKGKSPTVNLSFTEDGRKISVSLDEFTKVFQSIGIVQTAQKKELSKSLDESVKKSVGTIAATEHGERILNHIIPLTPERKSTLKQHLALLEIVRDNFKMIVEIRKKDSNIRFGEYLQSMCLASIQIEVTAILLIICGENAVSSKIKDETKRIHLPKWIFQRLLVKKAISKDTKPYSFLFPRKKEKGLKVTTAQLLDPDFKDFHGEVLGKSGAILKILEEKSFLQETIGLDKFLAEEENQILYEEFEWTVIPPLEDDIDQFLDVNAKNTIPIDDVRQGNLRSLLQKVNNAVLRTSQLQGSGIAPGVHIAEVFFPLSIDEYAPTRIQNLFEQIKSEKNYIDVVTQYINLSGEQAQSLFADMLSIELRLSSTKSARNFFVQKKEEKEETFMVSNAVSEETTENVTTNVVTESIQSMDAVNLSTSAEEKEEIQEETPGLAEVPEGTYNYEGVLNPRILDYANGTIREGDARFPMIRRAADRIFPEERENESEERRVLYSSRLSKGASRLVDELEQAFPASKKKFASFLRGFESSRLQYEAAMKMVAQIDVIVEDEDNDEGYPSDNEE